MIHNYMEHVERIKLQQFNETSETSTAGRVRSVGDKYNSEEIWDVNKLYVCPFNLNVGPMSNRETDITLFPFPPGERGLCRWESSLHLVGGLCSPLTPKPG